MRFRSHLKNTNFLIDITPLVDVTFLMLIFFLITSDILPLKSLNIENPTVDRDTTPLTTQLLVVMDAQNVLYIGSKKEIVDLTSLKEHLNKEIIKLKKRHSGVKPSVVLSVDRRVDYGSFLRMFAIAQECSSHIRLVYNPANDSSEYF